MAKTEGQKEVEAVIHRGYRAGVCDIDGNSVDGFDKTPIAKPRTMRPTVRIRFSNGHKEINRGKGWHRCES